MTFESQVTDQAGQDQLEAVAAEFDRWRSQKSTHAERIPATLLREAQKLSQHYKATEVRRRLGLSKAQLDKFEALDQERHNEREEAPDFMRLVPHHQQAHPAELTIVVCTPQGVKMSLSGFSAQDPLAIIAKLIGA
jgi:uncharacterized membrane-anchored protein YhcB (DUF1043 family)